MTKQGASSPPTPPGRRPPPRRLRSPPPAPSRRPRATRRRGPPSRRPRRPRPHRATSSDNGPVNTEDRRRLYALPQRPHNAHRANVTGQLDNLLAKRMPGYSTFKSYFGARPALRPAARWSCGRSRRAQRWSPAPSSAASARPSTLAPAPQLLDPARRARRSPKIDPKPILDGWKLLEATAIYRAAGKNPFTDGAGTSNVTQDLLLRKAQLQQQVLADPRLSIYACGRNDIRTGQIDRADPRRDGVPGRQRLPADDHLAQVRPQPPDHLGNVSEHSTGDAMDIAAINGVPVAGHQGRGRSPTR